LGNKEGMIRIGYKHDHIHKTYAHAGRTFPSYYKPRALLWAICLLAFQAVTIMKSHEFAEDEY
jgi:hypothetical protein